MPMKIKKKTMHTYMYKNKLQNIFNSTAQNSCLSLFPLLQFAEQFEENLWCAVHPTET